MPRGHLRLVSLVVLAAVLGSAGAAAHGGLRRSDPAPGTTLGATPARIHLSFSEKPEPALSTIRVLDTNGAAWQTGTPQPVATDPLSLSIPVRQLPRGVYLVHWRVVSAVDGHATAGSYAFGVLVAPGAIAGTADASAEPSRLEMLARAIFIAGVMLLAGAGTARVARFGGPRDLPLAGGGLAIGCAGLALLTMAQARNAGVPLTDLFGTSVGRGLMWRAVGLVCAGIVLLAARFGVGNRGRADRFPPAMAFMTACALAVMAVHAASGHAAAGGGRQQVVAIAVQWAHFAAAGIWLGGLAALLLGIRGQPSGATSISVRRYSQIAAIGLLVVAATGLLRTVGELSRWNELITTAYGQALLAKIALLALIAGLGAFNRWRSVPAAATALKPLRWAGGGELVLTAGAIAAAAVLGTLPTPAAGVALPSGLEVAAADFGTTVRVRLTTASDQPGPNTFVLHVTDYDSGDAVRARAVTLRFVPLDDPGVPPTSLALTQGRDGTYAGSGPNLAFDGRWLVTARIELASESVDVPLEIESRAPKPFTTTFRVPGQDPEYTVEVRGIGHIRFTPHPERAGRSEVFVTFFTGIFESFAVEQVVVTVASGEGAARQVRVRRLERHRFVADVDLARGRNRIAAVGRAADGTRLRAAVDINLP